jgi:hypothetical protein
MRIGGGLNLRPVIDQRLEAKQATIRRVLYRVRHFELSPANFRQVQSVTAVLKNRKVNEW